MRTAYLTTFLTAALAAGPASAQIAAAPAGGINATTTLGSQPATLGTTTSLGNTAGFSPGITAGAGVTAVPGTPANTFTQPAVAAQAADARATAMGVTGSTGSLPVTSTSTGMNALGTTINGAAFTNGIAAQSMLTAAQTATGPFVVPTYVPVYVPQPVGAAPAAPAAVQGPVMTSEQANAPPAEEGAAAAQNEVRDLPPPPIFRSVPGGRANTYLPPGNDPRSVPGGRAAMWP